MGRTQVVREEPQHGLAVLLGVALLTQIRQAQQPTEGDIAFSRQQGRKLHAQAALVDVPELYKLQR